jgi:RNA polymerase subunit RPABC4/transcription elongation factor Spt4
MDWPEAREKGIYRVCQDCNEICLCAEETCPNCGGSVITKVKLGVENLLDGAKIRCKMRYEALFPGNG